MQIDFSFIADRADVVNGKLYVLGGNIDAIHGKQIPVVHKSISVVMKLLFDPAEIGKNHTLQVELMDGDGKRTISAGGPLIVQSNPNTPKGWPESLLAVLNFENVKFERFDTYEFKIIFNNRVEKGIPIRITQIIG